MADNPQWESIPESHKKILAGVARNTEEFAKQATSLGYSKEITGNLLQAAQTYTPHSEPLTPSTPTTTDKLTEKLSDYAKNYGKPDHVGNHYYAGTQLDQRQKDMTWNIDVESDNFEQTKNVKNGKTLGEDEHFRQFWDNKDSGYEARIKNIPSEGLTSSEIEIRNSDIRDQMRREYLHGMMKSAGTFSEGMNALHTWDFTYHKTADEALQKQKGFLERDYERADKQERFFVQNNLTSATWNFKNTAFNLNGQKYTLSKGSLITKDPRFATFFADTAFLNATPAQRNFMLNKFYGDNKQYIQTNYQGIFPKGFRPSTDTQKKKLEELSRRQIQLQKQRKQTQPPGIPTRNLPTLPNTQPLTTPSSRGYGDLNRKTNLRTVWKQGAKKLARNNLRRDIVSRRAPTVSGRLLRMLDRLNLEASFIGADVSEFASPVLSPLQNVFSQAGSFTKQQTQNSVRSINQRVLPRVNSALQRGASRGIENGLRGMANTTKNISRMINRIRELAQLARAAAVAVQGATAAIGFLAWGWWIILLIIILIIIIIILFVIFGGGASMQSGAGSIPGLTITKIGPDRINNGAKLAYEIDVACDTTCQGLGSILIYDPFPPGTSFSSADGSRVSDTDPITWKLDANTPSSTDSDGTNHYIFHFTLNTTIKDTNIANIAYGRLENGSYQPIPGLTLTKTGPSQVANNQQITYTIKTIYTGSFDVTLTDTLPSNTSFVSATGINTHAGNQVSWNLNANAKDKSCGGTTCTFTLVLQPTAKDIVVSNTIVATAQGNNGYTGNGKNIIWLNSYSHIEFDPHFPDWVWSQCSQASMAEIFNAYAPNNPDGSPKYKIVELETWGLQAGVWDPNLGLKFNPTAARSIQMEADHFGFNSSYKTYPVNDASLNTLIQIANSGTPVMVDAPNHWLVFWGADPDGQNVWLLDSSGHAFTYAPKSWPAGASNTFKMPRDAFLHGGINNTDLRTQYWLGDAVTFSPK